MFIHVSFRDALVIPCPRIRLDVSAARTTLWILPVSVNVSLVSEPVSGPSAHVLGPQNKEAMWRPARPWRLFGLGSAKSTSHLDGDSARLRVQYGNPTAASGGACGRRWGNEVPPRRNGWHLTYACSGLNIKFCCEQHATWREPYSTFLPPRARSGWIRAGQDKSSQVPGDHRHHPPLFSESAPDIVLGRRRRYMSLPS